MKRNLVITALILLVLCLTGCSSVFDAAISGSVKDSSAENSSSSSGAIADAMVYAYDSESAMNSAFESYDDTTVFSDNSVPSAKTTADGSFSIATLRWKTNSPSYGKDADSKRVYLLVFHKDYGLNKVAGRLVQSDKSNNFGVVYLDKVRTSKNLVINFKDLDHTGNGSDNISNTSDFSYRYSYNDGYGIVTDTISSVTNGTSTLVVKYKEDSAVPVVTISGIQSGSDWTYKGSDSVTMEYDENAKSFKNNSLYFTNDWKTVNLTINLKDGSASGQSTITDPIYFEWSYPNGDGDTVKSDSVTTSTGNVTIGIKFKKNTNNTCDVTLKSFSNAEGCDNDWTWTRASDDARKSDVESIVVSVNGDKDTVSKSVYFRKNVLKLDSGISGYFVSTKTGTDGGYGNATDDGVDIYLKYEDENGEMKVYYPSARTSYQFVGTAGSTDRIMNHGYFSGLGKGSRIPLTYESDESMDEISYKSKDVTLTVTDETNSKSYVVNSMTTSFSDIIFVK